MPNKITFKSDSLVDDSFPMSDLPRNTFAIVTHAPNGSNAIGSPVYRGLFHEDPTSRHNYYTSIFLLETETWICDPELYLCRYLRPGEQLIIERP
jgi:hypothetical protein